MYTGRKKGMSKQRAAISVTTKQSPKVIPTYLLHARALQWQCRGHPKTEKILFIYLFFKNGEIEKKKRKRVGGWEESRSSHLNTGLVLISVGSKGLRTCSDIISTRYQWLRSSLSSPFGSHLESMDWSCCSVAISRRVYVQNTQAHTHTYIYIQTISR